MQYSQKRLSYGKAYEFAEGGRKVVRSFSPSGAQTVDYTEINIRMLGLPPGHSFDNKDPEGIVITAMPGGFSCCLEPFRIKVPYNDAHSPEEFGESVLCAIASDARMGGFGTFEWDEARLALIFTARTPGFEVDFEVEADPRYCEYCVRTRGTQKSEGFRPGQLVITAPEKVFHGDPFETLFAPTEDLTLAGACSSVVGIVMSCGSGMGEQAPVSYQSGFPIASNCDSPCAPPPTCVRVLKSGPPIWYRLMDTWTGGDCLYYNYEPEEGQPDTGMIYANPGPGRAKLADVIKYAIEGREEGGRVLKIRFG